MRRFLVVAALLLLVIPAASPYFGAGVPRTNDLFPHLHRTFALGQALEWGGSLWPRWSAELVHGYGYPVFNFFPSLSHLLIYAIHKLGLGLTNAYRLGVGIHLFVAAGGAYLLGRELSHGRVLAGYAAASAYIYSPYLLYDAHVRGAPPELQALALLPWLVLGLMRVGQGGWAWRRAAVVSLLFAATFLSHYAFLFQLTIPLGVWLVLGSRGEQGSITQHSALSTQHSALVTQLLALLWGGLLVAFFALPALVEQPATRANLSISQGYTYEQNFLSLGDLVAWPAFPADPALINPPVVRPLPLIALAWVVLLGVMGWRTFSATNRRQIGVWTAVLLTTLFFATPLSRWLWANLPLLHLTLYPWRMLGMTSLATAALIALVWPPHQEGKVAKLLPLLFAATLLLATLPWLYPPREPVAEQITQESVSRAEVPPLFIGTTTLGEFLPIAVTELPDTAAQRDALIATGNPDRLQSAEGVTAVRLVDNPTDAYYTLQASQPVTLTYNQFYFPGWQATLNGSSLPLTPSSPHGLITLAVPTGEHDLHLWFGATAVRRLGTVISGVAFLAAVAVLLWSQLPAKAEPKPAPSHFSPFTFHFYHLLPPAFLILLWLLISLVDTPLRRPTLSAEGILGQPAITPIDFAGELRLLSYTLSATELAADDPLLVTLFWQPQRPIGLDYAIGLQLLDANGLLWSEPETARPSDWRFVAGDDPWPLDGYRMDPYFIRFLDGAPPQTYTLLVGLVRKDTGQTVASHTIATVTITEASQGARPLEPALTPRHTTTNPHLLGSKLDRATARPGDPLRVTLLWEVGEGQPTAETFSLHLRDEAGVSWWQAERPIATLPLSQWQTGSRWRSETLLRLPAHLPTGVYQWEAAVGDQTVGLETITITAPERQFAPPDMAYPLDTPMGTVATLLGANLTTQNDTLQVELIWRAEAETETSYHVFVHLLAKGGDGRPVAQADGEPANWSRATTGWLPSEIITDLHTIPLPADLPEPYTLMVGLYDPATGERLGTAPIEP